MPDFESPRFPLWLRLVACASVVDMKDRRFINRPWDPDDVDDGINYRAAYRSWRHEYEQWQTVTTKIAISTTGELFGTQNVSADQLKADGLVPFEETLPDGYHFHPYPDGGGMMCNVSHEAHAGTT